VIPHPSKKLAKKLPCHTQMPYIKKQHNEESLHSPNCNSTDAIQVFWHLIASYHIPQCN
jgi:hypothetical protein